MNYKVSHVIFNINMQVRKLTMIQNDKIYNYKILNLLGTGSVGDVYIIELDNEYYIIKISNNDKYFLLDEVKRITKYFKKNKIVHKSYPLFYGELLNINAYGIIYPYFGFYNLISINKTNYIIKYNQKILIIRQIIEQLKSLNNIIHCDIKSENIVINIKLNSIISTIVDFGLIKEKTESICSVSYITSPESLLTLKEFNHLVSDPIDNSKHDYYGLFSIIIDLFSKNSTWNNFITYFYNIGLYNENHEISFVYCWYRFFYNNIDELPNETYKKLINTIETKYINKDLKFVNFDVFIDNLDFDYKYIKDFLKKIIHLNPYERPCLDDLLKHDFLII
jgi:serine/threonine protein kinase